MKRFLLLLLLTQLAFAQTEGTIDSAGSKLYYRAFGKGKPMLIINGGPGLDSDGFVSLAEKLSASNQTIIYDQRGTGKSILPEISDQTITMDLMVADIENLRKHLKIEKWIVLGHSFGGILAGYYATKHPKSIEGIIMSSSGGVDLGLRNYANSRMRSMLDETQLGIFDKCNKRIAEGDTSKETRYARALAMAHAYAYNKKAVGPIAKRLAVVDLKINNLVWQDLERIKFDCTTKLKSFLAPVVVIQGKNDILDVKTAEKIHQAFPNATLMLIDRCGHYGWLDAPETYFSAINQFLKTV